IGFIELLKTELFEPEHFRKTAKQLIDALWQGYASTKQEQGEAEPPKAVSNSDEPPSPADNSQTLEAKSEEKNDLPPPPAGGTQGEETQLNAEAAIDDGLNAAPPEEAPETGAMARYHIYTTAYDE